jgi:lipopolysaccharide/colanic/teichoic acid biosynthesis glycosyltransferase
MLKRILDVVIASTALVLLSPVYALVAYKVKKNLVLPYFFAKRVRAYMDSRLK